MSEKTIKVIAYQVITALAAAMRYTNATSHDVVQFTGEDGKEHLKSVMTYDLKIKNIEDLGIYHITIRLSVQLVGCSYNHDLKKWVWSGDIYHLWAGDVANSLIFKNLDGVEVESNVRNGFNDVNLGECQTEGMVNEMAEIAFATLDGIERALIIREILAAANASAEIKPPSKKS